MTVSAEEVREFVDEVKGIEAFDKDGIDLLYLDLQDINTFHIFTDGQIEFLHLVLKKLGYLADEHVLVLERLREYRDLRERVNKFLLQEDKLLSDEAKLIVLSFVALAKKMWSGLRKKTVRNVSESAQQNGNRMVDEDEEKAFSLEYKRLISDIEQGIENGPILLRGDKGTGKSELARKIYKAFFKSHGGRIDGEAIKPLVQWSAAQSKEGCEEAVARLKGWDKGSWGDGRVEAHPGYFENANNSVFFIDEIAELSLDMQAELLTALQPVTEPGKEDLPKAYYTQRKGGSEHYSRFLLVTATDRDLEGMLSTGEFRSQLYDRIASGVVLKIPPLSKRPFFIGTAIPILLQDANKNSRRHENVSFAPDVERMCVDYARSRPWPNNMRGLEQFIGNLVKAALRAKKTCIDEAVFKCVTDPNSPMDDRVCDKQDVCAPISVAPAEVNAQVILTSDVAHKILDVLHIAVDKKGGNLRIRILAELAIALMHNPKDCQTDIAMRVRREVDGDVGGTADAAKQWVNSNLNAFRDAGGMTLNWTRFKQIVFNEMENVKAIVG